MALSAIGVLTGCPMPTTATSISKLGPDPGWSFEQAQELDDPCSSLEISTTSNTVFPAGTTVTFTDGNGQTFNGDTSTVAGTTLYAGLPSNTLAGDFEVIIQTPGGPSQLAGIIKYDDNPCKK